MTTNSEKGFIEKLNQLIDDNLDNPTFSTDNMCRELGISRSQLYRLVKEQTELSTSLYIRKRKLIKSKELLENSDFKIAEIAYKLGIDSPQNFTKYFTQEFGISPTEFRKFQPISEEREFIQTIDFQETNENISPKKPKNFIYYWLGLALFLITTFGIYFWQKNQMPTNIIPVNNENSIAILPFKNLGKPENSFFSDGVMEQIHSSISLIENLKVISKTSSNQFRDSQKPIPQIANQLHVGYILAGSVLQLDNKVRITIELIYAKEDRAVWAKNYEGDTKDIFRFMSKVSSEVAGELNQKLSKVFSKKLEKIPTKSLEAYNEYLQGIQLVKSRSKEKLEAGILKFNNALQLDTDFADSYAELGNAYFLMGDGRYIDVVLAQKMAEKNALNAIRLDAENVLAYGTLANIYRDQFKWEQANTTYQIALKYNPNDALINYWYSLMLRSLGRMDEAIKYSSKAVELDPLYHVITGGHIFNCMIGKRVDLAEKSIKENELLMNESWVYYWVKGYYYLEKDDFKAALKEIEKSLQLNPNVRLVRNQIYFCKAKLGKTDEVNAYLKTLSDTPDNYTSFIIIYAGLGNKDRSMSYLEKSATLGIIPTDLKVMNYFNILRNDKRYDAILQKFGLL